MPTRNHIELVEKTLRVLEALSGGSSSLKVLASRLGLVKSSVFRILYTLKELGYVEQASGTGAYRLTTKVVALARAPALRPTLLSVAPPYLARLRDELDESAWLAELRAGAVVLVDVAEASHKLRLSLDLGDSCPWHASALGKAVAAYMPATQLSATLGRGKLPRYTANTIASRSRLAAELAKVRRQGYATNDEETIEGAMLVGAPIFDSLGKAFAAVSVSSPTARCSPEKRGRMVAAIKTATAAISADLMTLGFKAPE